MAHTNLIKIKKDFLDLFSSRNHALKVKYNIHSRDQSTLIRIENKLEKEIDPKGLDTIRKLCGDTRLFSFADSYSKYNGFSLGIPIGPKYRFKKPLLRQVSASELGKFTKNYMPNGKWAKVMDMNKIRWLYRNDYNWLAFAEIDAGPDCLTIFLDGRNTGKIFIASPQPHINIFRPIAHSYKDLLNRIARDPAGFLKLIRADVTFMGKDYQLQGKVQVEYIDDYKFS